MTHSSILWPGAPLSFSSWLPEHSFSSVPESLEPSSSTRSGLREEPPAGVRRHDRNHHYTFLACANTSSSIFAQVFRDYCVVIITCSSHEPGTGSFYLFGGSCLGTTGLESRAATGCGGGLRRRGGVGERRRKHLPSLFTSLGDGRGMERREKSVPSVHYRNLSYQISNIHMNTVACPSVGGCGVKRGRREGEKLISFTV